MSFLRGYARKLGVTEYLGTWNASTNTPTLTSSTGQRGGYYIVSVAGTTSLNGINDWGVNDWVIFNGSAWEKIDNSEQVTSVANKSGAVTLEPSDIQGFNDAVEIIVSVEESTRTSADASLTTRLSTEESTRTSADASVVAKLTDILGGVSPDIIDTLTGITNAMTDGSAATGIINAIAAENSQRSAADTSLTSRVSIEESTRTSADASLTTRLSTEESTRTSADASLTTRLSTEESTRTAEDLTFLKLNGSRSMTGNLNLASNSIDNILNLTATGTATVNKSILTYGIQVPNSTATTTNGSLNLTATSNSLQYLTGSATGFSIVLPNSTTVMAGQYFEIYNTSSVAITIKKNSGATLTTVNASSVVKITAQTTAVQDGDWLTWSLEVAQASGITNFTLATSAAFATTSATDTQITNFVLTPAAGKYAIWYNATNSSTTNNALNYVSLYKNTTQITGTERVTQSVASGFVFQMSSQGVETFNGAEELRVYARVSTGTFTINARSLIMIRLGG